MSTSLKFVPCERFSDGVSLCEDKTLHLSSEERRLISNRLSSYFVKVCQIRISPRVWSRVGSEGRADKEL